jgi:hypothetical protein
MFIGVWITLAFTRAKERKMSIIYILNISHPVRLVLVPSPPIHGYGIED